MGQILAKFWGPQTEEALYVEYNPEDITAVLDILDDPTRSNFKWRVWWVAASGFFTASYCIFSTNVVSPALNYVYPLSGDCGKISKQSLIVNLTTLTGTIVGMVVFGYLADAKGRKKLYGIELMIVIIGTIGLVQSSKGYNSMNVYAWIGVWRFIQGVGLGAEYPLSATIAAEWSSTKTRGRMMASVFLMQAVGQITAYIVSICVVIGLGNKLELAEHVNDQDPQRVEKARSAVDAIWRCIISVGAFPALMAILLRRLLPETPRFLAEHASVMAAMRETGIVYNARTHPVPAQQEHDGDGHPSPDPDPVGNHPLFASSPHRTVPRGDGTDGSTHGSAVNSAHGSSSSSSRADPRRDDLEIAPQRDIRAAVVGYLEGMRIYLAQNSRWRALMGVCVTWYLLDLSVYGLGLDSPKTIATMYLAAPAAELSCDETWRADPAQPNITIYEMLIQNTQRNLQTITTGTLPGSVIILLVIDYVPRATWMACTFAALAALFAVTGSTLFVAYESDKHAMTLVFYVLMQLVNNLGPNTMTWILPAELFATRYRATLYGLAAAAGKLGAITIQLINGLSVSGRGKIPFAGMLLGLSPAMLLGAFFSWVWVPEVQEARARDSEDAEPDWVRARDNSSGPASGDERGASDARSLPPAPPQQAKASRGGTRARAFLGSLILPNRTLEDIAQDPARGQIIGIRRSVKNAWRGFFGRRMEAVGDPSAEIEMS